MLELEQESDRRGSATDHRDTLASELGSVDEVDGVHVASAKFGGARVPGSEGGTPGSGCVDHDIRLQLQCLISVGVANEEVGARAENRGHDHRSNHLEAEVPFVLPVEIGNDLFRGEGAVDALEAQIEIGHRGQVVDAVGRTDAQRLPAVLPRAAGRGSPIEDDHVGARVQPQFLQVMSDRESRLPRTDHDDAMAVRDDCHGARLPARGRLPIEPDAARPRHPDRRVVRDLSPPGSAKVEVEFVAFSVGHMLCAAFLRAGGNREGVIHGTRSPEG